MATDTYLFAKQCKKMIESIANVYCASALKKSVGAVSVKTDIFFAYSYDVCDRILRMRCCDACCVGSIIGRCFKGA